MQASIIIPTYNRSDVLLRSLGTWTKQSVPAPDFEMIVVDNNSTDNSAQLIQDFIKPFPNFHYLFEKKAGSTKARHAGAAMAQSDILIFCDDDGLYNENCVEAVLDVYKQKPEVAAVAGKIEIQWDAEAPDWIDPYLFMLGRLNYGDRVCYGHNFYLNGGIFSIRREVFNELGGFNPDLVGKYLVGNGDTGLVIKLHRAGKLIGWTPFAEMKHLQFVDTHGTIKDLGRRFYNTGISETYAMFRKNKFIWHSSVFRYISNSIIFLLKKQIEFSITNRNEKKAYFSLMQRKGEIAFFLQLRHREIRQSIFTQNGLF